jgi:tetratricopeptide (TPR) repeat protein
MMYAQVSKRQNTSAGVYRFLLFIFFLSGMQVGYSQNIKKIDSLRFAASKVKDEKRWILLNQLIWECRSAFPDSAIAYGQKALTLSKKIGFEKQDGKTLNYVGLAYYYKGNLIRAFEYYEQASKRAEISGDSVELGYSQNNIGRLFSEQGMIKQAYPYFVRAESLFRFTRDSSGLAYAMQSFANLYKAENNFVQSEQLYRQALQIRKQLGSNRDIASAYVLLGKLYIDLKQYTDALLCFQKADSASLKIQDALARAEIKILMAEYFLKTGDLTLSEELCMEGLRSIMNFKNVKLLPRAYLTLGEISLLNANDGAARKYFTIALNLSKQMKYLDYKMQAHYHLWKLAEKTSNREEELIHSNEYLVLKDSVNDINLTERIAKFKFQLEIERKEQENNLLKANQAKNETTIQHKNEQGLGLLVILLLSFSLLYFQWRNVRRKKEANLTLAKQKEQIESINLQLSRLVNETTERNIILQHHVSTLLEFSKSKVVNFGTIQEAVQDIARLTAQTLKVSRVSVWTYDKKARSLASVSCYDLVAEKFLDKMVLDLSLFPMYEEALNTTRIIDAPDAHNHPCTKEFTETYLVPLDIHSMLDVTFSLNGELSGLICCEQQHTLRAWKSEDIIFTSSVADITSLAYHSVQRREYERRLRQQSKEVTQMNELLEQRVRERTAELQSRNDQLTEYAFINSHLLRSPVSKILGLINLFELDKNGDPKEMMKHLKQSCNDLDSIVKKITLALESGEHFDRKDIKSPPL